MHLGRQLQTKRDDISLISEIILYSYSASHLLLVLRLPVLCILGYVLSSASIPTAGLSEPIAILRPIPLS
jgi:hypothetical protein